MESQRKYSLLSVYLPVSFIKKVIRMVGSRVAPVTLLTPPCLTYEGPPLAAFFFGFCVNDRLLAMNLQSQLLARDARIHKD